jgi:hypothetical protein
MQLRGTSRLFLIGMLLVAIGNLVVTLLAVTALASTLDSAEALREVGRVMFPIVTAVWTLGLIMGLFFAVIGAALAFGKEAKSSR